MSEETVEKIELIPALELSWSTSIGKLAECLAKAQLKFKPVLKQTDNAAFMRNGKASKYADLAEYIDATQEALANEGLVVTQWPDVSPEAKSVSLVSVLMHSSGEWMKGKITLPATGRDGFTAQSCGSSITYARRYSYAAITGCASEDDDGNAASGRGTVAAQKEVAKQKIAELTPKDTLTYVMPKEHNGHKAEFLNIASFLAANEDKADSVKLLLSKHKAKKTKDETALVPSEEMQSLLEALNGDLGVKVHQLQPM